MRNLIILILASVTFGCGNAPVTSNGTNVVNTNRSAPAVPEFTYELVTTYPHDQNAFTQGLAFHNGFLYEGTGGKEGDAFYSSLRKIDLTSGTVIQKHDLDRNYFGEGIAILNDEVYQVTWKEGTAFVYNLSDLKPVRELRYSGQGWGLTHDGTNLYLSDGTHVIRVVDPETFRTVRTIVVMDEKGKPVIELNELEWVKGEIWANVWQKDTIVRIDPANGKVTGRIDLKPIAVEARKAGRRAEVMNGIAYDEASDRLFITGKFWQKVYEIRVVPKQ
jgi:glutamine cyclotransferase